MNCVRSPLDNVFATDVTRSIWLCFADLFFNIFARRIHAKRKRNCSFPNRFSCIHTCRIQNTNENRSVYLCASTNLAQNFFGCERSISLDIVAFSLRFILISWHFYTQPKILNELNRIVGVILKLIVGTSGGLRIWRSPKCGKSSLILFLWTKEMVMTPIWKPQKPFDKTRNKVLREFWTRALKRTPQIYFDNPPLVDTREYICTFRRK